MRRDELPQLEVASYLRRIGRGAIGSRSLNRQESEKLFFALYSGSLSEASIGALLMALRVKGETADELLGALDALPNFIDKVPTLPDRPVIAIPSYNGARNLPNLTWLLALLLARQGLQVIVHGMSTDHDEGKRRTRTEQIVNAYGSKPLVSLQDACAQFEQQRPVYVPLPLLSPALATLLERRVELGVRNTAHSLVKMLNPSDRTDCLRVCSFTHPEFEQLQHRVFELLKVPAIIMRGTEGEVVANVRRPSKIDLLNRGFALTVVTEPSLKNFVPLNLPNRADCEATVQYMVEVLSGATSVPAALAAQIEAIVYAARLP